MINPNTFSVGAFVLIGVVFFFYTTGKWRYDKILFTLSITTIFCLVGMYYGHFNQAVQIEVTGIVLSILYSALLRKKIYTRKMI